MFNSCPYSVIGLTKVLQVLAWKCIQDRISLAISIHICSDFGKRVSLVSLPPALGPHHGQLSGPHWRDIPLVGFHSVHTLRGALWAPHPSHGVSDV